MLVRDIKSNKKLVFHYFHLASDYTMEQLGTLIEKDLGKNFSLFQTSDNAVWNPFVLLFWTETPLEVVPNTLCNLFRNNEHIAFWNNEVSGLLNNGQHPCTCSDVNVRTDNPRNFWHFVIAHNYEDGEYIYRFGAALSFHETLRGLCGANNTIKEGTVIDYIFIAEPAVGNRFFIPINFKVKDSYWDGSKENFFLADVKGIYDLKTINPRLFGELSFIKVLPDKIKPETISRTSGTGISYYICYPEEKISITINGITYPDIHTSFERDFMRNMGNIKRVIVPKKKELRERLLKVAMEQSQEEMETCYLGENITKADAVKMFLGNVKKRKDERQQNDKLSLENYYGQIVAERRHMLERKEAIKERTKSFIPIPHILIPQSTQGSIHDLTLYLHRRNNKYYLDREEVNLQ